MNKIVLFVLIVMFFTIIPLQAKTIWMLNLTSKHQNMNKMVNGITDDLKLTKYKSNIKYIDSYSKLNRNPGDIIIEMNGVSLESGSGNVSSFYYVLYKVQDNWCDDYLSNNGALFSPDYLFEQVRNMRDKIIETLEKHF